MRVRREQELSDGQIQSKRYSNQDYDIKDSKPRKKGKERNYRSITGHNLHLVCAFHNSILLIIQTNHYFIASLLNTMMQGRHKSKMGVHDANVVIFFV